MDNDKIDCDLQIDDDNNLLNSLSGGKLLIDSQAQNVQASDFINQINFDRNEKSNSGSIHLRFDVVSAKLVKEFTNKYVLYTICIYDYKKGAKKNLMVERRYSQFNLLNQSLKKKFPHLMAHIAFPEKHFFGNCQNKVITLRSRAFEQFLTHICSIDVIKYSEELKFFLYGNDLKLSFIAMKNKEFKNAVELLQNVAKFQKEIFGISDFDFQITLCCLVACCSEISDNNVGCEFAKIALFSIGDDNNCPFLAPLLETTIRLCWQTGQEKERLEEKLNTLKSSGIAMNCPKLLTMALDLLSLQLENKVANVI